MAVVLNVKGKVFGGQVKPIIVGRFFSVFVNGGLDYSLSGAVLVNHSLGRRLVGDVGGDVALGGDMVFAKVSVNGYAVLSDFVGIVLNVHADRTAAVRLGSRAGHVEQVARGQFGRGDGRSDHKAVDVSSVGNKVGFVFVLSGRFDYVAVSRPKRGERHVIRLVGYGRFDVGYLFVGRVADNDRGGSGRIKLVP